MSSSSAMLSVVASNDGDADTPPNTKLPEVGRVVKVATWRTPDGVYHESLDTVRKTLMREAISEFIIINEIDGMDEVAAALAIHLPTITARVESAMTKMT